MEDREIPGGPDSAWRNEISARLDHYRARRKIRPPRYRSLTLPFDTGEVLDASAPPAPFEPVSDRALALDGMMARSPASGAAVPPAQEFRVQAPVPDASASATPSGAKILEFPRFNWDPPATPPDQLAEPVVAMPRILEVPEVEPPPPALGGISMEVSDRKESGKQSGVDVPLESVSLARRILASAIDWLIVAAATTLFAFIFWKVAGVRPPRIQLAGLAAGIPCLFWSAYQYLLIVYSGRTPGLWLAGLQLARFDGRSTNRSLRRWRVLASYLSGASLGMGFAWVLLDEDGLCWHDRITRTYLAPRRRSPGSTIPSRP